MYRAFATKAFDSARIAAEEPAAEAPTAGAGLGVRAGIAVGDDLGVAVGLGLGVAVGTGDAVGRGVGVGVGVGVRVGRGVGVAAGVAVAVGVGVGVDTANALAASAPSRFLTSSSNALRVAGSSSACAHPPNDFSISTYRLSEASASSARPAADCARLRRTSPSARSAGWSRNPNVAMRSSSIAS